MRGKLIVISILILLVMGCKKTYLKSYWKESDITIDGNDNDWSGLKCYVEEQKVTLGLVNDNKFLYFCFYPTDEILSSRLLRNGFTIWFNEVGKTKKDFGIRLKQNPNNKIEMGHYKGSNFSDNNDIKKLSLDHDTVSKAKLIEIIDSDNNITDMIEIDRLSGFEFSQGVHNRRVIIEMKIPYNCNEEYSINLNKGKNPNIAILLETNNSEKEIPPKNYSENNKKRPPANQHRMTGRNRKSPLDDNNKSKYQPSFSKIWAVIQLSNEE